MNEAHERLIGVNGQSSSCLNVLGRGLAPSSVLATPFDGMRVESVAMDPIEVETRPETKQ